MLQLTGTWNHHFIKDRKNQSCSNLLALFQTNLPGLQELQKASSFSTNIKRLMQWQQMPCELTKNMCFPLLRELAFSVKFQIINSCMSQRTEKLLYLNSQQIDHGENVCYAAKECSCTCWPVLTKKQHVI